MRKINFVNNNYYHIYNRGVDRRQTFIDKKDYERFLLGLREFNNINVIGSLRKQELSSCNYRSSTPAPAQKLIDIFAYNLLPNHFHFIIKQLEDAGISKFMHRLSTSYTNYFNIRNKRSGSLFQGRFKAIHINSDEYLIWLSAYIHMNSEIHKIAKVENYPWSNYQEFLKLNNKENIVLDKFNKIEDYKKYCQDLIPVWQEKKEIQKFILE